jgi:hypothetical protein
LIITVRNRRKESKEIKESKKSKGAGRKNDSRKDQEFTKAKESANSELKIAARNKNIGLETKKRPLEETALVGPFSGNPSLIQSNFGRKGNFELVVPLISGGFGHYWRNNDDSELPWYGPIRFGNDLGKFDAASIFQSNFGNLGNLELAATEITGKNLIHFWRDSGPDFDWHGPIYIAEPSDKAFFCGNPSMIQSRYGCRGNFDLVVPVKEGGFAHYWRNNDDPALPWYGPFSFGSSAGVRYEAATLIQSNFGSPGNLELIARFEDQLAFFWQDSGPEFKWNGPFVLDKGITGCPCLIQSRFGQKGNFELVVPLASGGLGYYWRDNDDDNLAWHGPLIFGTRLGQVDSVTFIQSNFGNPGNFELVARVGGQLAFFWRDSGPDLRWNGPYFSLPFQ